MATLTKQGTRLLVATPYNADFVNLLKEKVPHNSRSYNRDERIWIVDAKYLQVIKDTAELYFDHVDVVHDKAQSKNTRQVILVEYMGRTKDDNSFNVAYANCFVNGSWSIRVSEKVLRSYFEGFNEAEQPTQQQDLTLYGLLGAKPASTVDELKRAYLRAAKVWHPDLNKDSDAAEMFKKVKSAWDTLSNPMIRAKYDAGLKLMQKQESPDPSWKSANLSTVSDYGYRAPATCGLVDCEIKQGIKQTISKIYDWKDDTRTFGSVTLVRVAYWQKGAKEFTTRWEQQ